MDDRTRQAVEKAIYWYRRYHESGRSQRCFDGSGEFEPDYDTIHVLSGVAWLQEVYAEEEGRCVIGLGILPKLGKPRKIVGRFMEHGI